MAYRGISPAISSLFLITVAVTGGISVGVAMNQQSQIISKSLKLDPLKIDLIRLHTPNKAFFSINIKNTGTIPISSATVGFYDKNNIFYSVSITDLEPGQTAGVSKIFDVQIFSNSKYQIHIKATGADGSTFESADMVRAI